MAGLSKSLLSREPPMKLENPKNYDLLGVWDVQKQGFRSVDCRTVISIESEFLSGVLNSELKASA
jgi:hypothetical protein